MQELLENQGEKSENGSQVPHQEENQQDEMATIFESLKALDIDESTLK